tara:strand:+ start:1349 stop:1600 length:252 start_codon:yes stop_codon:yes gene_type:complete
MDDRERQNIIDHLRMLEQQKVSIYHFLQQLHTIIEEMNLMYDAIEEYLMVIRAEVGEEEVKEARDNIVPLFYRENTDEPGESA